MNRFLNRKKDKKKGEPEPKPALDLASALPAADDFRTSLILPGLSTRFSMLREQDDPNSKLGKAMDDSVLHPKRQSRLHEFGFAPGLTDIAEVSSLKGSLNDSLNGPIRPPFASERSGSFDSQATEEGASVMSRARPGEGNVLFGGRQKIYKIGGSGTSGGRLLYDDDVHLSTFQKMRREEKERLAAEAEEATGEPPSPSKDPYSPSTEGFNRRRETSSSTNSGSNARISTAATSVASQGANSVTPGPTSPTEITRSTTKARRLYDQGLDQQMYEQQSSAMNRLNSIQRTRAHTGRATPPHLFTQTRSATNLSDRFTKGGVHRMESPTSQASPVFPNGKDSPTHASSPILSRPQSPLLTSPLVSDGEDAQTLNTALQPQDRGKATAMGAFNKPKNAFSEEQYRDRLRQMQLEREASAAKLDSPRKTTFADRGEPLVSRKPSLPERTEPENPKKPSLRERAELEKRKRAEAGATTAGAAIERKRSESSAKPQEATSAFSVFQSAANQMKHAPAAAVQSPNLSHSVRSPDSQNGATFFASAGSSEDESDNSHPAPKPVERGRRKENLPVATGPAPPILEHPALRSRSNSRPPPESDHPALRSRSNSPPTQIELPSPNPEAASKADLDSPTLGPNNGGLSGLIRQHLRNVSNVSSNYDDDRQSMNPPPLQTQNIGLGLQRRQPQKETDTNSNSTYNHSNPWDLDDLESNPFYNERTSMSSVSPVDAPKPQPQAYPVSPMSPLSPDVPAFMQEEDKTHQRGRSVEEHEAFQRDLAQRQRAIQESLRARAEGRSTSPAPPGGPSGGLKNALNMLRAKSSRESFATVDNGRNPDGTLKSMKVLGLGANSVNASSTSLAGVPEGSSLRHMRAAPHGEPRQRSATGDSNRAVHPQNRSPPTSSRGSGRDRSSSEVSSGRPGRSRSRPPHYRDDLQQAMGEGVGSRSTYYPPNSSPSVPGGYSVNATQPLPAERSSPDQSSKSRSRSNSKSAAYFESKHLKPIHTGNGMPNTTAAHLSPGNRPQNSPGLPASPRPSPGGPSPVFRPQVSPLPPGSAANTPPVSNPGTPDKVAFNPDARPPPMAKVGTLRKKSIAKADIGEPMFVSTTSVIDTVNLPPGASLKNGMETAPPPVPPINPRRRFGFGRPEHRDPAIHAGLDSPQPPFANSQRTNSYEGMSDQSASSRPALRKTMSEGRSLHGNAQVQSVNSPPMPAGPFGARKASPPRPINRTPAAQRNMDGAMF